MLEKTVKIGEQEVRFRSSASVPRLYRIKFKRDIFKDLSKLEKSFKEKGSEDGSMMEIDDLEIFENVAYGMPSKQRSARHGIRSKTWCRSGSCSLWSL